MISKQTRKKLNRLTREIEVLRQDNRILLTDIEKILYQKLSKKELDKMKSLYMLYPKLSDLILNIYPEYNLKNITAPFRKNG